MTKGEVQKNEFNKLSKIFRKVADPQKQLVEELIRQAAFLVGENFALEEILNKTGMVIINPKYPTIQKPVVAAEQYRKNLSAYAAAIRVLNNILQKNPVDEDDGFDEFMKQQSENNV